MEVRSRAPGKIILAGEHAVVHGSTAIAAAIDLYTHVLFRLPPPSENQVSVELELKDMGLVFSWPSQRLEEAFSTIDTLPPILQPCSEDRLELILSLVKEKSIPEDKLWLSSGICAFLYLYTSIHGYKPATVAITSELPLGSGLGSSASFCVALASAFLSLTTAVSVNGERSGWLTLSASNLDLVNKWAFEGEKILHGKPSGIDNTVSTLGSLIMFKSGELTQLQSTTPLRMLITNTKVTRNTKALVAGVAEKASRHPGVIHAIFTAIDFISKELATIIETPAIGDISIRAREKLIEELMEMNQGLLQIIKVSHDSIEKVLQTTAKYKLASKLTGAGGGGCVLTLLPTSISNTVVEKVVAELEALGFQCLKAEVGGNGVQVCFG
ncbi:mevalonate kinase [Phalaenopsis equestris]|uniref:mevalonate kinase n=1 Tax=Phalaenopsis equestris TaxID=78828 RepID=UPI0009E3D71D|nr:mevalonate kinase [Phalaenopsis equestris]XP_020591965.1 mevalonate kinase [Phalaenopsis equestris]XP_020591966.1 mevalonate kinase [Phalaenopsis equestris]